MRARYVTGWLACAVIWAGAAGGCAGTTVPSLEAGDGPNREAPPGRKVGPDAPWPYWPQRLRVHPLSQFTADRSIGGTIIECRLEFTDRDGDTSKAVGIVDIELHDGDLARGSEPVAKWAADLWLPEVNRERYDPVTRTYLFTLQIDEHLIPLSPQLYVFFLSADGKRLQAAYQLPPP
jgi:hypothetical protein